jgi:hypothetical protein
MHLIPLELVGTYGSCFADQNLHYNPTRYTRLTKTFTIAFQLRAIAETELDRALSSYEILRVCLMALQTASYRTETENNINYTPC